MFASSHLFFLLSLIVTLFAFASALPVDRRDVWVPKILYPHAGTVWKVGNQHNVTWDISQEPAQVTNPIGQIQLRKDGLTQPDVLASGFNLTDGRVVITVPDVTPDSAYQLVLFGDSGNFSPEFTIEAA